MRADADPARLGEIDRLLHRIGVSGVKAAGDVDGRRKVEHRGIVPHRPDPKTFAEIAVEVDRHEFSIPM
jgi:hypothetical protein